jgi:hypothetical protein
MWKQVEGGTRAAPLIARFKWKCHNVQFSIKVSCTPGRSLQMTTAANNAQLLLQLVGTAIT